jgi:DNA-binding transcriptional ArsR family regulator
LTIPETRAIINHMVEYSSQQLDAVFHALADGTRRRMLRSLGGQPRSVGELAAPFQISLAAASKHIKVLERAGLVTRTIHGRTHLCRLQPEALAASQQWLRFYEQFWNQSLDALEAVLTKDVSTFPKEVQAKPDKTKRKNTSSKSGKS